MLYKLHGKALAVGVAFTDSNGTNYPANWLNFSTAEDRAAVPTGGIKWEDDPPYYDKRFYWNQSTAKDIDDLKKAWIQNQKDSANNLLQPTDWLIVRKAEAGTAVPSDTTTYRTAVRTQCKAREDQITACSDTAALAKLVNAGDTREKFNTSKEVFDTSKEKKDGSGNSYDPKQYESFDPKQYESFSPKQWEQNPDGLKMWPEID